MCATCFTCVSALKEKRLRCAKADVAFITRGNQYQKDATHPLFVAMRVQLVTGKL